jgi:hypothetical protein
VLGRAGQSLAVEPVQQTVNAQTGVHTEPVQSASSPPPVPAAAKAKDVFGDFLPPPPASIMLTFGSKSVADFILNWYVTSAWSSFVFRRGSVVAQQRQGSESGRVS